MEIRPTELEGAYVIEPRVFEDARGFFMETFRQTNFGEGDFAAEFVQDNLSRSCKGTVRGLHYQIEQAQGKLVQVIRGEIFDVIVDLRRGSSTFGRWCGLHLSEENHKQLFVPPGFAHGFCVLSEIADFTYKCTDYYAPEHQKTLLWNDPELGIEWPLEGEPVLSEKDRNGTPFAEAVCYS